jgi:hypothetical protein
MTHNSAQQVAFLLSRTDMLKDRGLNVVAGLDGASRGWRLPDDT